MYVGGFTINTIAEYKNEARIIIYSIEITLNEIQLISNKVIKPVYGNENSIL